MILQQKTNEAEYIGDIVENKVGIDTRNIDFITTLLTSNLYSKPFASFLRETISNAYDSHIEAKTKDPIILLIEDVESKYDTIRVSIRDFGVGISPERFDLIYKNIGSSTKRESNDFIGCFGIGRFSCLSCADVANIISYYNGVKYSYLMYKNNGGINIDKLSEEKGNFKNGLEVSVEVSIGGTEFAEAIRGLYLFDNLHIEFKSCTGRYRHTIEDFKNRKIHRGKDYHFIENDQRYTYVALGNVLYPCTLPSLRTSGIILNIPMGSVDITPNRESLQYTNRTKTVLENKVKSITDQWSLYASKRFSNTTLSEFYKYTTRGIIEIDGFRVQKDDIKLKSSIVKIDGEPMPEDYDNFLHSIRWVTIPRDEVYRVIHSTKSGRSNIIFGNLLEQTWRTGLKMDQVTKGSTLDYFRNELGECVIFNHKDIVNLSEALVDTFKHSLYRYTREQISADTLFTLKHLNVVKISNDSVPQEYLDKLKEIARSKKEAGTIKDETIRIFSAMGYRQESLKWFLKLQFKSIPFIVYAANTKDENKDYRQIADLLEHYYKQQAYIHPVMVTMKSSAIPFIKNRKKFVHVSDFLYLRNNFWSKMITADIIYNQFAKIKIDGLTPRIPRFKEFNEKYRMQISCLSYARSLSMYEDIKKMYIDNGWVNMYDIKYFKITDDEFNIIKETRDLLINSHDLVYGMLFKKFGINDKLGIKKPKSFIYKYIKL